MTSLQHRRQAELLELRDVGVDRAQHHADAALLHERVDAEAADAGRADREVALLVRLELGGLLVVHHAAHELDRVLRRELRLRHRADLAVDLDRRRKARRDEQVGALLLDQQVEQLVDEFGCAFAFHAWPSLSGVAVRRQPCEQFLVDCAVARLGDVDEVAAHQLDQALVERLHADRLRRLDRRVHLRDLAFADQVADRRRADHDLVRRDAALAVLGLHQRLRDHRRRAIRTASRGPFPFPPPGTRR